LTWRERWREASSRRELDGMTRKATTGAPVSRPLTCSPPNGRLIDVPAFSRSAEADANVCVKWMARGQEAAGVIENSLGSSDLSPISPLISPGRARRASPEFYASRLAKRKKVREKASVYLITVILISSDTIAGSRYRKIARECSNAAVLSATVENDNRLLRRATKSRFR